MNMENLKMIIDSLNNLGSGAKEAFYWWLIINYGLSYFIGLIWSVIGGLAIWKGIKMGEVAIRGSSQIEILANAAGTAYYFSNRELTKATNILRKHWNDKEAPDA